MVSSAGTFPYVDTDGTVWLAFSDWGPGKRNRILMCLHGLTRQSRDFDFLAQSLSKDFRVIEVDLAGHGKSGWLGDKHSYTIEKYLRHIEGLIGYRGINQMDWLGTFTGGIIGILLAAKEDTPIRRLILNDIGAIVSNESLHHFYAKFETPPVFTKISETEQYFKRVYSEMGPLEDKQWSDFIIHSINREPGPSYSMHYDPAVLSGLTAIDVWDAYDKVQCPVLLLRGENSSILDRKTAEMMTKRGPKAELVEIKKCGHAPSLMTDYQVSVIVNWLQETEQPSDSVDTSSE